MKRVVIDRFGGPEVLRVVEDETPRPAQGEVRVRLLVAGVSFTDAQLRAGTYLGVPRPPFTPGYELVGVVDGVGPGCSKLHVGDRVAALTAYGAYAEQVCVPEEEAVLVPAELDPALAFLPLASQFIEKGGRIGVRARRADEDAVDRRGPRVHLGRDADKARQLVLRVGMFEQRSNGWAICQRDCLIVADDRDVEECLEDPALG